MSDSVGFSGIQILAVSLFSVGFGVLSFDHDKEWPINVGPSSQSSSVNDNRITITIIIEC